MSGKQLFVFICGIGLTAIGCVSPSYQFGVPSPGSCSVHGPQACVEPDNCHPQLDRLERVVQAPRRKLGQWFGKPWDAAREREEQQLALQASIQYLTDHSLFDVHIDHRRYAPAEQWQRLRGNDRFHPVLKYTDGAARVLVSTLLPGRVLQRDSYNPYTNTLSLNSASPANAVIESAASRYDRTAPYPGLRAVSQRLPFVSIYHQSMIASDALSYSRAKGLWALEKDLYPAAYRNIGSNLLGDIHSLNPVTGSAAIVARPLVGVLGGAVGAGAGRMAVKLQTQRREKRTD